MATATTRFDHGEAISNISPQEPVQTEIDFKNMTISELQNTCRGNKWKGHSKCKVKKELVVFCDKKYKEDKDILCSICTRVFCDCSALSEKDKKIKELQDKVKEYELKELEDTDENTNNDEDNDEDNSYDCNNGNCFEFNSEYGRLEDST